MAAFDFSVVSWCPRSYQLMFDASLVTEKVEWMDSIRFHKMCELSTVVGLDDFRMIPKVLDRHLDEEDCCVRGLFTERIDKSFSAGFVDHRVLVKLIWNLPCITRFGHVLYIELPLNSQFVWGVVRLCSIRLFMLYFLVDNAEFTQYAIKGNRMSSISFAKLHLGVKLKQRDGWISPVIVLDVL